MADNFKIYPRGSIAIGTGNLSQVTNVKIETSTSAKLKHTLRQNAVGVVLGNEETTVSFDMEIHEGANPENQDFLARVRTGAVTQIRIKASEETIAVDGVFTKRSMELPLDDAIKATLDFVGRISN